MRLLAVLAVLAPAVAPQEPAAAPWADAAAHGEQARRALIRCRAYLHGWLRAGSDPLTGLIASNLTKGRDLWEPHNAAADNYAFMVLTAALTDPDLYRTRLLHMLDTETQLTSRVGALPDTYRFSTRGFAHPQVDLRRVVFAASEYAKDGLMPIHELLGETPWSARMRAIVTDLWRHAPIPTPRGPLPATDAEVAGEMMQVTARMYWLTGDAAWLDRACRLADRFLLEAGHHPTRDAEVLRLRDHGCELVSGLSEVYFACHHARRLTADAYRAPLHAVLDRILEVGVDGHGMMYDAVNPKTGAVLRPGRSDAWGYVYDAFYTVWLVDGVERYRDAVRRALASLAPHFRGYAWEGESADGYADSIEGALNLLAREPAFGAEVGVPGWIDSEIAIMLEKQRDDGVVEGWHGDGNYARTALMYALWKQQGCRIEPWREDVALGAVRDGDSVALVVRAAAPWHGRVRFDPPRHRTVMHLPADYPRINQFPEWFTVEPDARYAVTVDGTEQRSTGATLAAGLELRVGQDDAGGVVRITVAPQD